MQHFIRKHSTRFRDGAAEWSVLFKLTRRRIRKNSDRSNGILCQFRDILLVISTLTDHEHTEETPPFLPAPPASITRNFHEGTHFGFFRP